MIKEGFEEGIGLLGFHGVVEFADSFDPTNDLISVPQIDRRFARETDAGWGPGQNDISWLKRHEACDIANQTGDREDHL
jgi:hypothetical protein